RKQEKYEEWAKNWSKVKGIFTEITSICDLVRKSARQCDEDSVVISAVSSLNQIEPSFMYTQLFKESILKIDFDKKKAIHDLAEYAHIIILVIIRFSILISIASCLIFSKIL
ncbi:unnamed protein product, partial [Rotaria sp. Silwood2]